MAKKQVKQLSKSFIDLIKAGLAKTKNHSVRVGNAKQKIKVTDIGELNEDEEVDLCNLIGKDHTTLYIRNVEFDADRDITIIGYYGHNVTFENCVFKDEITVFAGNVTFKNCKFYATANTNSVNGICLPGKVFFEKCNHFSNGVRINDVDEVYVNNCKGISFLTMQAVHYSVYIDDLQGCSCSLIDSSLKHVDFDKVKCDKLILNRCYIEHLTIIRSRLSEVSIYNLLDGENFNLSDSTIGEFYTNHAAVFGGFHSHKTTIGTYNLNYTTGIKPPSNDIILYKKCEGRPDKNDSSEDYDSDCDIVIVKLSVPAKAKRVYCGDLKIRVSEATVVDFYHPDGSKYELKDGWCVSSNWNKKFKYHIGATVKPEEKFNPTSGQCGSGIHGFTEFKDAVNY